MPGGYAGHLRTDDPLHGYLSHYVLPRMGVTAQQVDFRVFCLKETKVYRYEESHSRTQAGGQVLREWEPTGVGGDGANAPGVRELAGIARVRAGWLGPAADGQANGSDYGKRTSRFPSVWSRRPHTTRDSLRRALEPLAARSKLASLAFALQPP